MPRLPRIVVVALVSMLASAARVGADCGALADADVVIKGFATALADDAFRLTATITPPAAFDPSVSGVTLVVENQFAGPIVDAAVPGGAGWRAAAHGGWSYRDPTGSAGGVTRVKIRPVVAGTFAIRIDGRRGDYARSTDILPLHVTLLVPDCIEVYFSVARCRFAASGNTLRCSPPPALRRCGATADDQVRCDAENAAAMEEAYFALHGTYHDGECIGLPGFTPSPGVLCVAAAAGDIGFSLVTASPYGTVGFACVYSSHPDHPGDPNLVCS